MKVLEVLPYSSVGGKGRETWEVETEAEATVAQVEEALGTAVSKVVGTSAAIWDVTKELQGVKRKKRTATDLLVLTRLFGT